MKALAVKVKMPRHGWDHEAGDVLVVRPANGVGASPSNTNMKEGMVLELWEILLPLSETGELIPRVDTEPIRAVTSEELSFGDEFLYTIE